VDAKIVIALAAEQQLVGEGVDLDGAGWHQS
jgi:hypothetical protein